MKSKIIFALIFAVTFFGYFTVNNAIGEKNHFLSGVISIIPNEIKEILKETLFIFNNKKILKSKKADKDKQLADKDKQLADKDKQLENKDKQLADKNEQLANILGFLPFNQSKEINYFELDGKIIVLKKYNSDLIFVANNKGYVKGTAYLEYFNNSIFIVTRSGIFSYVNIEKFKNSSFKAKIIESNIKDLIQYDDFFYKSVFGIKDVLIHDDKIYISYVNQVEKDCYNTSILVSDLSLTKLAFESFFTPNICVKRTNSYGEFSAYYSGGRMVAYKNNKILFTLGEYKFRDHAQDKSNLLGKIISIEVNTKKYEIISMGHRNPQGLFYDNQNDVILSTEHGPKGGDEININTMPGGEIENYGWAISSYGEYSRFVKRDDNHPYKSHKKHGFVEPVKYFTPSIGISEIIKINSEFLNHIQNEILVASMGQQIDEGALSIHYFAFDSDYRIKKHNILKINDRIRDMIYVGKINKIFLFLERSASIGVLSVDNN